MPCTFDFNLKEQLRTGQLFFPRMPLCAQAKKTPKNQTQNSERGRMELTPGYLLKNCWNCGRKASETCSGCNTARYCGSFCQHKDWEKHHHICGQTLQAQQQGETPAVSSSVTPSSGAGSPIDTPPAATPRSTTPGTPSTIEATPR
uniref:MYND-type domain-containing protein n=1 Tax=Pavo cristatus TaxID=9049 RepID=A0A8C9LA12_PAVCR